MAPRNVAPASCALTIGPKDAAMLLGISERSTTRMMQSGEIPAIRLGRLWKTTPAWITTHIEDLRKTAVAAQVAADSNHSDILALQAQMDRVLFRLGINPGL